MPHAPMNTHTKHAGVLSPMTPQRQRTSRNRGFCSFMRPFDRFFFLNDAGAGATTGSGAGSTATTGTASSPQPLTIGPASSPQPLAIRLSSTPQPSTSPVPPGRECVQDCKCVQTNNYIEIAIKPPPHFQTHSQHLQSSAGALSPAAQSSSPQVGTGASGGVMTSS